MRRQINYWQWTNRGFFSELSLFTYAKYYSKIKGDDFLVSFKKSNLGSENINYYFTAEEEIKEKNISILDYRKINRKNNVLERFLDKAIGCYFGKKFLSHNSLYSVVWSNDYQSKIVSGENSLKDFYSFVRSEWNLSDKLSLRCNEVLESKGLDSDYLAIHVRRGDKLRVEAEQQSISEYFLDVNLSNVSKVFVATDDFSVISEVENYLNDIKVSLPIVSLVDASKNGHLQSQFNSRTDKEIRKDIENLIIEVEIMRRSKIFVGSFTSNIGRYVYMLRSGKNAYSVDIPFTLYYNPYK